MTAILGIVASGLELAANLAGWGAAWFRAKQSPAMQADAASVVTQKQQDKLSQDIASGNLQAVQRDEAESQTPPK